MKKNTLNYLIVDKMEKIDEKLAALEKESKDLEKQIDDITLNSTLDSIQRSIAFLESALDIIFACLGIFVILEIISCFLRL